MTGFAPFVEDNTLIAKRVACERQKPPVKPVAFSVEPRRRSSARLAQCLTNARVNVLLTDDADLVLVSNVLANGHVLDSMRACKRQYAMI